MKKVIFLDRDGVINKYPGHRKYIESLENFKFLKGSKEAVANLTKAGYTIFVISNQAGVTKGLYTKKTLDKMTRYMSSEIQKVGGRIKKTFYCLHTEEMNCKCRKPKAGLLKIAVKNLKVDKKNSYFIGDSLRDVLAGRSFGCKTILVLSGCEKLKNASSWNTAPDFIAKNLAQAAKNIINNRYERA